MVEEMGASSPASPIVGVPAATSFVGGAGMIFRVEMEVNSQPVEAGVGLEVEARVDDQPVEAGAGPDVVARADN